MTPPRTLGVHKDVLPEIFQILYTHPRGENNQQIVENEARDRQDISTVVGYLMPNPIYIYIYIYIYI